MLYLQRGHKWSQMNVKQQCYKESHKNLTELDKKDTNMQNCKEMMTETEDKHKLAQKGLEDHRETQSLKIKQKIYIFVCKVAAM